MVSLYHYWFSTQPKLSTEESPGLHRSPFSVIFFLLLMFHKNIIKKYFFIFLILLVAAGGFFLAANFYAGAEKRVTIYINPLESGQNIAIAELPTAEFPIDDGKVLAAETEIPRPNYFVSPAGSDSASGRSAENAFKTIQKAIDSAQPGEMISLADGEYFQDFVSRRNGEKEAPITVSGTAKAIVKGAGKDRVIEINHDYLTLDGFTVDGLGGNPKKAGGYRDKLIYVQGKEKLSGVTGLLITKMTIKNAGGECVRLRYFSQGNEISYNTIGPCGVHDFAFDGDGKNGEGVYIGTAPEQLKDGKNPTSDVDQSNKNRIHHNTFNTQGNECVDIKEGSSENIVEYNQCTGQKDPESGGMDSRGNNNIFRNNEIYGCSGAGVRLGGDTSKYGIGNSVYGNIIRANEAGGIKIMRKTQAQICGNTFSDNGKDILVGKYDSGADPDAKCGT